MPDEPRVWKPHAIQEEFIRIPFTVFEALYGGAAGGGKSELLLALPILYRFHEHPKFHGIIFRRSFPELKESLIPRAYGFYQPFGGKYNAADHVWNFPSGSQIRLSHLQDENAARSHDTAEFNYVGFDELTAFEEFLYIFLTSRVRSSTPELPAIVRAATNPGNIGHAWVKTRFVEPCKTGRKIIYDSITKQKRIFIPAKLTDNPYLLENDPTYGDRLKMLPDMEQKAKLLGDWDIFAGQAFSEFRAHRYPNEPDTALHVVPYSSVTIPLWYPRVLAIDWGRAAMTAAYWGAITPDSRCIIYREYAEKFKETATWATEIGNLSLGETILHTSLDPSAWQDRGDPETIAKRFMQFSGLIPFPASNDRISGKLLVHEFLRWRAKPARVIPKEGYKQDLAQQILRTRGLKDFDNYRNLFVDEPPETNLPKLIITDNCPVLIKTIGECIVDEKRPNDVAEFEGDDPYDCLRYLLKVIELYVTGVLNESRKRMAESKIMQRFAETQDYLTFHHQMDKFEKSSKVIPIRLGHHDKSKYRPATGLNGVFKRRA
jgi:hypothetical protein